MVLEDGWHEDQLEPFLSVDAGPARFLVTTRVTSLLGGAHAVRLDELDRAQSRAVLLADLPALPEPTVARLLGAMGGWALVVNSASATLRRAIRDGANPASCSAWLADALTAEGVGVLDLGNTAARDRTFAATIRPSLALLSEVQRSRAYELSIFAEEAEIDLILVGLLWSVTGGLTPTQTRALVSELKDLNVLSDFRPDLGTLRIHDLVRDHLAAQLDEDATRAAHATLLTAAASHYAVRAEATGDRQWWAVPDSATYLWRHLTWHLAMARLVSELDGVLTDLRWTQAKLLGLGPASLDADLTVSTDPTVAALRQALHREAHLFGPVFPAHSHTDVLAARLATDPALVEAVDRFRASMPGGVVRIRPGWPLPDAPIGAMRRVLTGPGVGGRGVAIAPDGTWLAAAGSDGTVGLWDATSGRPRATLTGHASSVTGVAIAPDGTWLATAGRDGTARLWDATTGRQRATLTGHTGPVTGVAIAPDGTWLATTGGSGDSTVRLWGANTGRQRATLTGHTGSAAGVAIAPDGTWLATAGSDGTVRLWDATTGKQGAALTGHTGLAADVAIAPDGRWLASAGSDGTIRVWDATTGRQRATLTGHTIEVYGVAIAPDGRWLASAGSDGTILLWDATTGRQRATLTGHTGSVTGVAIAFDGTWLATTGSDGTARLWDATTGRPRATGHTGPVTGVAIAPDGTWLATTGSWGDKTIRLWGATTGRQRATLTSDTGSVTGVAIAPDGTWLATAGSEGTVRLWDATTGKHRAALTGHTDWVNGVAIAPDGTWLASAGSDGTIRLWDATTGRQRATLTGHTGSVTGVAIAPDGTWLATAGGWRDNTVQLWTFDVPGRGRWRWRWRWRQALGGQERAALTGHTDSVNGVAIAPDGAWLASAGSDGTVRLWDAATGTPRATLTGHTSHVTGVAIAPDGTWLATTGGDQTVRLWGVAAGANVATMRVAGPLSAVGWAPDGRAVFVAGQYGPYRFDVDLG